MSSIPEIPAVPPDGGGRSSIVMRYEDVAQDGRALVESLATSVNETLWRVALRGHPIDVHAFSSGTLALLTRFVVEGGEGPFDVDGPFDAETTFVFSHGLDANGQVDRLYLNAWIDTWAPIGRTNFAPPANAGERALVGRAFAEHVFTRPFAPATERKVTRFDFPGLPTVPPHRYAPAPLSALLARPEGARAIDPSLALDELRVAFGLRHTDSNQHVNSLVYPQLFEESCLRRFAAQGRDTKLLARTLEIAYRKPCFAGQAVRIALATFEAQGKLGACGGFYDAAEIERAGLAGATPYAYVRMTFDGPAR